MLLNRFSVLLFMFTGILLGWGAALSSVVKMVATVTNPYVCYRGGIAEVDYCFMHGFGRRLVCMFVRVRA